MLENYLRAQYGPFLPNPYLTSESFYTQLVDEAKRFITERSFVLDVGCATGRLVFEFEKQGARESVGIDTSVRFIDFCNLLKSGKSAIVYEVPENSTSQFICDDIFTTRQIMPHSFDFISSINIIDRVHNPELFISTLHALLKEGGVLMLVDPYHWSLSPAPTRLHVNDMKDLLQLDRWSILDEKKLPFTMPLSASSEIHYECHLVVALKK